MGRILDAFGGPADDNEGEDLVQDVTNLAEAFSRVVTAALGELGVAIAASAPHGRSLVVRSTSPENPERKYVVVLATNTTADKLVEFLIEQQVADAKADGTGDDFDRSAVSNN